MDVAAVLDRLTAIGVTVDVDGDELVLRPGSLVPDLMLEEVRAVKPELLTYLSWSCMDCGGHDYWKFSEAAGGGRACIACHPLPLTLAREWELRTGRELPPGTSRADYTTALQEPQEAPHEH